MKILFADLDGTVRESATGATFINDPYDQRLIPGVKEAIARYPYPEWSIIGITNQGGVAAGFKTLENCITEQQRTMELSKANELEYPRIKCIYFCPDNGETCWRVIDDFGIDEANQIDTSVVDRHFHPYLKQWVGKFRKPNHGMIEIAIARLGFGVKLNRSECLFVGDRPEDQQAAANANIPFMWAEDWRK